MRLFIIANITFQEFKTLKIGDRICDSKAEVWEITDVDQFGPDSNVFGMRKVNTNEFSSGRISLCNYCFWERIYK